MPRIIYPAHTEPVFVPSAAPSVPSFDWFASFSVPIRRVVVVASDSVLPPSTASETTTVERWHAPLSAPVRLPRALHASLQQPHSEPVSLLRETTTVDRWFTPFGLPVWPPCGLRVSLQLTSVEPVLQTTSAVVSVDMVSYLEFRSPVFRDSSPSGSGWSTGFSTGFGPLGGDEGSLEFGSAIQSDVVVPFDVSLSAARNVIVPAEWSGMMVTTTDAAEAVEWRATFAADATDAIERRATLSLDAAIPSEWLLSFIALRDASVPVEWLASTVIATDAADAVEWRGSTAFVPSMFAEWRGPAVTDASASAEWRATTVSDAPGGAWWLTGAVSDIGAPTDEGASATSYGVSPTDPIGSTSAAPQVVAEWRSSPYLGAVVAAEWRTPVTADGPSLTAWFATPGASILVPAEWNIAVAPVDTAIQTEPATTGQIDASTLIDWRMPAATNAAVALETPYRIAGGPDVPVAFWQTPYLDASMGVNWTGPLGVILDSGVFLEWRSAPFTDGMAPIETGATTVRDGVAPVVWLATQSRDDTAPTGVAATATTDVFPPVVWTSVPVVTVAFGVAWGASASVDAVAYIGSSLIRVRDDGAVLDPGSTSTLITNDPAEWGGATGIVEDAAAGVEFRSERGVDVRSATAWTAVSQADAVSQVDRVSAVAPTDYAVPSSWNISVAVDNTVGTDWSAPAVFNLVIPLDFTGAVGMVSGDADAPFEYGSTSLVDAVAWVDWGISFSARHVKGAMVEVGDHHARPAVAEGSGPKGATLDVPDVPEPKPVAEGSGTKGGTLSDRR